MRRPKSSGALNAHAGAMSEVFPTRYGCSGTGFCDASVWHGPTIWKTIDLGDPELVRQKVAVPPIFWVIQIVLCPERKDFRTISVQRFRLGGLFSRCGSSWIQ